MEPAEQIQALLEEALKAMGLADFPSASNMGVPG